MSLLVTNCQNHQTFLQVCAKSTATALALWKLKIKKHVDKTVTVETYFTHYGHYKNICCTWISQKKKKKKWNEIAAKLQKGVSKQKILDDIRNNVGAEFPCDDIIDKQDVVNIQRA